MGGQTFLFTKDPKKSDEHAPTLPIQLRRPCIKTLLHTGRLNGKIYQLIYMPDSMMAFSLYFNHRKSSLCKHALAVAAHCVTIGANSMMKL